jgi:plastocyanin
MKKNIAVIVVVALVVVGIGASVAMRRNGEPVTGTSTSSTAADQNDESTSGTEHTAMNNAQSQQDSQPAQSTSKVSIENFAFTPAHITVRKGTTVTWTNNDSTSHNVVSDTTTGPQSEVLGNGKSYSYTFNEAGEFSYKCGLHPSMTGTVTVTE